MEKSIEVLLQEMMEIARDGNTATLDRAADGTLLIDEHVGTNMHWIDDPGYTTLYTIKANESYADMDDEQWAEEYAAHLTSVYAEIGVVA